MISKMLVEAIIVIADLAKLKKKDWKNLGWFNQNYPGRCLTES
jgi:hypothetical protein